MKWPKKCGILYPLLLQLVLLCPQEGKPGCNQSATETWTWIRTMIYISKYSPHWLLLSVLVLQVYLLDGKDLDFLNGDYRFFEHALLTSVAIHGDDRLVHICCCLRNLWSNSKNNADCCSGPMTLVFHLLMPAYVANNGLHGEKSDRPSKILRATMWNGQLGILFWFF